MATRGFSGRGSTPGERRLPPGQSLTTDFPVLSAGPTPRVDTQTWTFTIKDGPRPVMQWDWTQFHKLPQREVACDIHCVTTWSKFDTRWRGVSIDDLLLAAGIDTPKPFVLAHSVDGYSTNVPTADLIGGKAIVALYYDNTPLSPDHGGPARLLVPHLYLWKSAKWINALQFLDRDEAGFWELRGYHMRGDPWQEQRYTDD